MKLDTFYDFENHEILPTLHYLPQQYKVKIVVCEVYCRRRKYRYVCFPDCLNVPLKIVQMDILNFQERMMPDFDYQLSSKSR